MLLVREQKPQETDKFRIFLAQRIQQSGLSILEIARGTGISRYILQAYLNGVRPAVRHCYQLASFLNISAEEILSLAYAQREDLLVDALLETYLALPEEERYIAEMIIFALRRNMGSRRDT